MATPESDSQYIKLKIEITGGNEAMQTSADFANLLQKTLWEITDLNLIAHVWINRLTPFHKTLHDINGNVVGLLTLEE